MCIRDRLIAHYFPEINFVEVLGQREGIPAKPDPSIINEIMTKAGVKQEDILLSLIHISKYALYHPHFGKDDNYIPSKAYYEKLEAITPINAGLLALKEYKAFLPDAISAFSNKGKTVASRCV